MQTATVRDSDAIRTLCMHPLHRHPSHPNITRPIPLSLICFLTIAGDEMNIHVPQTEEARAEAMSLMGVLR